MWKIAHGTFSTGCTKNGSRAMRMNTTSPAYMLPNRRRARLSGLVSRPRISRNRLNGTSDQWLNGVNASSLVKPPRPLTLTL
ncbi:hypothetical protein D3C71_2144800 [compost metagenome]